jgi:3,4-dihydroxy 2-butanone 4-phosphate synthase / GTP cyclohydrolase II
MGEAQGRQATAVTKVAETTLPTEEYGTFRLLGFESSDKSEGVVALVRGDLGAEPVPLVRIHSQCLTGDVFGSSRCDCGAQLNLALEKIASHGAGVLIYQLQEGRGIGLMNKLLAYALQDSGQDTVEANHHLGFEADQRNYAVCADVLRTLSVAAVRLMSNNPKKIEALERAGIRVVERVPIEIAPSDSTKNYLQTKKAKLGHLLSKV